MLSIVQCAAIRRVLVTWLPSCQLSAVLKPSYTTQNARLKPTSRSNVIDGLNYHIAIGHEGNLRFRCEKCGKGFTQKCSLELHIGSIHEATNMPFQCNKCNIKFPRKNGKNSLSYHIALTHQELTCNICFISFPTNFDLQEHIKAHDGKEPFNCNICNTKIITHQDLMKHASTVHVGVGNIN